MRIVSSSPDVLTLSTRPRQVWQMILLAAGSSALGVVLFLSDGSQRHPKWMLEVLGGLSVLTGVFVLARVKYRKCLFDRPGNTARFDENGVLGCARIIIGLAEIQEVYVKQTLGSRNRIIHHLVLRILDGREIDL